MPLRPVSDFFPIKVSTGKGFKTFFKKTTSKVKSFLTSKVGKKLLETGKNFGTFTKKVLIPVLKSIARNTLPVITKTAANILASQFESETTQKIIKDIGEAVSKDLKKNVPSILTSKKKPPVKKKPPSKKAPKKGRKRKGGRDMLASSNILNNLLGPPRKVTGRGLMFLDS